MSIFTIHYDISTLNFHTDFQSGNVNLDLFRFDIWLDIQDFIFGLGVSIFPIHPDISILNFHTDFQSGKVNSDPCRFDFWLVIQDFIFELGM